jgi:hypothetical protein
VPGWHRRAESGPPRSRRPSLLLAARVRRVAVAPAARFVVAGDELTLKLNRFRCVSSEAVVARPNAADENSNRVKKSIPLLDSSLQQKAGFWLLEAYSGHF